MGSNDSSLANRLSALHVNTEILNFPNSYPDCNPVDIYRCYISDTLANITNLDAKTIFSALQWMQTLDKGDLNLAVPRLRVNGYAPNDLAKQWAEAVSISRKLRGQEAKLDN